MFIFRIIRRSSSSGSRFSESESKMESARDMFFDAVTVPTSGDFDDDDIENDSGVDDDDVDDSCRRVAVNRLRFADRDFPSVLVTFGVVNAVSWAPFFLLLLAEPLLVNPLPHFISLLVVFLGYAQTLATPPMICLLYGRISDALGDALGRLLLARARSSRGGGGATTCSASSATPKTSLSHGVSVDSPI